MNTFQLHLERDVYYQTEIISITGYLITIVFKYLLKTHYFIKGTNPMLKLHFTTTKLIKREKIKLTNTGLTNEYYETNRVMS